jgi:RNA polymerase sigma-70 factor (ECF subfamily)
MHFEDWSRRRDNLICMSLAREPKDQELIRRAASGDREAFAAFFRRHRHGVYRFALNMSGSQATAEEVTQEVFMTLIREPDSYDPNRGSAAAFLYGIARNHVLRVKKREWRFAGLPDGEGDPDSAVWASEDSTIRDLIRDEEALAVRKAILSLPTAHREVVVLCELEEMSYAEAADILGCAIGTVRSRLHRARQSLRQTLEALREGDRKPRGAPEAE